MFSQKNAWRDGVSRRIWLLGASSGMGEALAQLLLVQGHRVALSARRDAPLIALAAQHPQQVLVLPCDVNAVESVRAAALRIQRDWDGIDTLVYNAGICEYIDDAKLDTETLKRVFETNFFGLSRTLEVTLPLMGRGAQVAAVSSSAAFLPLPRAEAYGASKAAMNYFLEALRLALSPRGISVNLICPGFVKTPLTDRNDFPMPCCLSAEQAAAAMLQGLKRDQSLIHFPKRFTQGLRLLGALPGPLQRLLTASLMRT